MTVLSDLRRSVTDTTPIYAVVGATDLAVERVRAARATLEQAGALATQAGVEATYDDLVVRGHRLVERIRTQRATQDLLAQSRSTLSRGKAVVTTVRRAGADTTAAARSTITVGRKETTGVAAGVAAESREAVRAGTVGTKRAAKRTATTASTRTARARSSARAATTSARTTTAAASKAAEAAARKVGA